MGNTHVHKPRFLNESHWCTIELRSLGTVGTVSATSQPKASSELSEKNFGLHRFRDQETSIHTPLEEVPALQTPSFRCCKGSRLKAQSRDRIVAFHGRTDRA